MPYRWETFPIQPEGGLVENIASLRQGIELPGSAARLVNFEVSIDGGYRRINGYTKFDPNIVTGTGLIYGVAYFEGDVIAVRNGNIYESTGAGWSAITSGRTHTTKHRFHIINLNGTRKLIGVDGSNYPYSWDGSSFVDINGSADVQGASHAAQFKDHIFYAKGDLVTFSVPFDETDFTVADGAGNFRVEDDVTGMFVFRERLYVFTESSIMVLDGDSQVDWRLTSVTEDIGCIEPDTIQEVAGDVAFLSNDGVRLLGATDRTGDFSNQVTSRPVQQNFIEFQNDNYTTYASTVIRGKSQYRIFGWSQARTAEATEGYAATQFEAQNPMSFRWGELKGFKVYSIDSQIYQGSEYIVFATGDVPETGAGATDWANGGDWSFNGDWSLTEGEGGYVYVMESGPTYDGNNIAAQYWTPYISFQDPTFRKTLYKLWAYYDPEGDVTGTLAINYDFNRSTAIQPEIITFSQSGGGPVFGSAIFGTATYGASTDDAVLETNVIGAGRNAQFQFTFDGGDPFIIDSILIEYANEDRN